MLFIVAYNTSLIYLSSIAALGPDFLWLAALLAAATFDLHLQCWRTVENGTGISFAH